MSALRAGYIRKTLTRDAITTVTREMIQAMMDVLVARGAFKN